MKKFVIINVLLGAGAALAGVALLVSLIGIGATELGTPDFKTFVTVAIWSTVILTAFFGGYLLSILEDHDRTNK